MGTSIADRLAEAKPERPNNVSAIDWHFDEETKIAILAAHGNGMSNAQIADILSEQHPVDTQDVYRWIRSQNV